MLYSMPLKPPVKVKQPGNIWTSVINAFQRPILSPPMNDTISKEKENITPKLNMKVKCKVCKRKLKNTTRCYRIDCPLIQEASNQIITFKDWKDPPFKVIEDLKCQTKEYDWPERTSRIFNTFTNQWEDRIINDF